MADKIYLLRGNDTPMAVCLRYSEGGGEPVPYDLSEAERVRLALVGHGMHIFARDTEVSGTDHNIVSGVIPGRSLLPGDYDLEVTFTLDGRDKRFAVDDMFEAVEFLSEDADNEAEGEGDGIEVTVTVQPEEITVAGPTGPQGPKGDKGDKGDPGSDADVTADNIVRALGYTPADEDDIPDVSQFITKTVGDLANYYLKTETYTQAEVNSLIGAIRQFHYEIYDTLPQSGEGNVLYLIGPTGSGSDRYEEYVYANNTWTKIGDTSIDLSGYVTTQALTQAVAGLSTAIEDKVDKVTGKGLSTNDYTTEEKDKLAGLPSGSELADDLDAKEDVSNKVTSVTSSGTDTQYPSAKAVHDAIEGKKDPTVIAESGAEIVYRQTHGGVATGFSGAAVKGLKGRTLAWNQLLQATKTNETEGDVTMTWENDHYHIAGTMNSMYISMEPIIVDGKMLTKTVAGHVYYFGGIRNTNPNVTVRPLVGSSADFNDPMVAVTNGAYIARLSDSLYSEYIYAAPGVTIDLDYYPQIIDLTLMFGEGNEPSTVAEFESMFPLPYYEYNEGELINNSAEGIETVGFNQWDEEWEIGYWDGGVKHYGPHNLMSKNLIPVIPGEEYYIKAPGYVHIEGFDAAKQFIGFVVEWHSPNFAFTIPAGCSFVAFYFYEDNITTYGNDVCINLSDASRNGQYEPHWSKVLPLGLDAFKVKDSQGNITTITGGLKSAGSVYDEIVGNKYIKRIGEVDLGSLAWYVTSGGIYGGTFYADVDNRKTGINILCGNYSTVSLSENLPDKCITEYAANDIAIRVNDTAYTTAEAFKTAMSGVYLYYELATPVEYELASPMPSLYAVDDLGTEAKYPADTAVAVTAPITADIQYGLKARDIAAEAEDIFTAIRNLQS